MTKIIEKASRIPLASSIKQSIIKWYTNGLPLLKIQYILNFSYSSQVQLKTLKITTYTYTDKKTLKSRKKKNIEWLETLKHKEKHDFWVPYIFFLLHLSQNRYWRSQKPINVNEHRPKKVKTKVYSLKSKNLKRRF